MDEIPINTRLALENLIRVAADEQVTPAGFAFSGSFIANFGNCSDKGDMKLYEELCRIRDKKVREGMIVEHPVHKAN